MPPADRHQQDISALRDRLTGLSQARLNINESLDRDHVFRQALSSARSLTGGQCPVKQPCRMSSLLPNFPGPFQSPPTSAPGELVEPSGTVLRQAQDERVRSTPNILKGPASFQYGRLACWWFPEPVPVSCNSSLHITAATKHSPLPTLT